MSNITKETGLVKVTKKVGPIPNCDVVIFKQLGGDTKEYYSTLAPNQKLKKKRLFDSASDLVGYAVSRDQNLHDEFSQKFLSGDQRGSFTLTFTMAYSVSNPRTITEKLSTDPLNRLRKEVVNVLGGTVRQLGWSTITDGNQDIESLALQHEKLDKSDGSGKLLPTNWEHLRDFADALGIELKQISFTLKLSEHSAPIVDVAIKEGEKIKESEHEAAMAEQRRKAKLKQQEALDNVERQEKIRTIERRQEFNDQVAQEILVKIKEGEVNSLPQFIESLNQLGIQGSFGTPRREPSVSASLGSTPTLSLSAPESSYLAKLIDQVFILFGDLNCEYQDKKRLFAGILHLLGELSLGTEADNDKVEYYSEELRTHFRSLFDDVDNMNQEQTDMMYKLLNTEVLKKKFT
jgi:hypothetical protein